MKERQEFDPEWYNEITTSFIDWCEATAATFRTRTGAPAIRRAIPGRVAFVTDGMILPFAIEQQFPIKKLMMEMEAQEKSNWRVEGALAVAKCIGTFYPNGANVTDMDGLPGLFFLKYMKDVFKNAVDKQHARNMYEAFLSYLY